MSEKSFARITRDVSKALETMLMYAAEVVRAYEEFLPGVTKAAA